ncbi:MAG TPA: LuxR C-terminal-related transcriptional regulator [Stellaceae bacterium]
MAAQVGFTMQLEQRRAEAVETVLAGSFHAYGLSVDALVRPFRLLWSGEWGFPSSAALDFTRPVVQPSDSELQAGGAQLSSDERKVLLQVIEGQTNKVIAQHLGKTEAAIKDHLANLLRKIRVENRTQATIWAFANLPELATGRLCRL